MRELLSLLKRTGCLTDPRLESALMELDRRDFVSPEVADEAYSDRALLSLASSGEICSTSTQPSLLISMIEELKLHEDNKVLDLGTGTGFCACLLGKMLTMGSVVSVETSRTVASIASENLRRYRVNNVQIVIGDGRYGFEEEAPYDAMISTVAFPGITVELFSQMKIGARSIVPIHRSYMNTPVFLFEKTGEVTLRAEIRTGAVFMVVEDSKPDPLYSDNKFSLELREGKFRRL
ncbi:MAG: methyltransferase [Mesotoga sp.]|jgi:protein-L-isoaspartate(D-aspartate) O-methyltransferase|uniref:protein-L-isoaspartate O-methyltransferase family protein n=1 Tax=Mesotoga sp. TaxID=2053577 RepID=UPI0026129EA9|nr:methyltransferase [Mesotoga sp.]MDD3681256.1 methyltransferase [Mesotoga sp.]